MNVESFFDLVAGFSNIEMIIACACVFLVLGWYNMYYWYKYEYSKSASGEQKPKTTAEKANK